MPLPSLCTRIIFIFLLALVAGTLAAQSLGGRPWDSSFRASQVDQINRLRSDSLYQIVDFASTNARLANINGDTLPLNVLLDGLRGSVVLVDLWGAYCAPCLKALPKLYQLIDKLDKEPFELIFLNVDNRITDWVKFSKLHPIGNKKYNYRLENKKLLTDMLALRSVPRYLLFDQQGRLCNAYVPAPGKGLEGYVRELLLER